MVPASSEDRPRIVPGSPCSGGSGRSVGVAGDHWSGPRKSDIAITGTTITGIKKSDENQDRGAWLPGPRGRATWTAGPGYLDRGAGTWTAGPGYLDRGAGLPGPRGRAPGPRGRAPGPRGRAPGPGPGPGTSPIPTSKFLTSQNRRKFII